MATGYTQEIIDNPNITFSDFTMKCVRAMGVCLEMRDMSTSAKIPDEFKPSDYYYKALKSSKSRLRRSKRMTAGQRYRMAKKLIERSLKSNLKSLVKKREMAILYKRVLKEIQNWKPPTDEHTNLKVFMNEQVVSSINFDCDETYTVDSLIENYKLDTRKIWREILKSAKKDITYNQKKWAIDVKMALDKTNYLKKLRESLN